jgi:hypothetical protein
LLAPHCAVWAGIADIEPEHLLPRRCDVAISEGPEKGDDRILLLFARTEIAELTLVLV